MRPGSAAGAARLSLGRLLPRPAADQGSFDVAPLVDGVVIGAIRGEGLELGVARPLPELLPHVRHLEREGSGCHETGFEDRSVSGAQVGLDGAADGVGRDGGWELPRTEEAMNLRAPEANGAREGADRHPRRGISGEVRLDLLPVHEDRKVAVRLGVSSDPPEPAIEDHAKDLAGSEPKQPAHGWDVCPVVHLRVNRDGAAQEARDQAARLAAVPKGLQAIAAACRSEKAMAMSFLTNPSR